MQAARCFRAFEMWSCSWYPWILGSEWQVLMHVLAFLNKFSPCTDVWQLQSCYHTMLHCDSSQISIHRCMLAVPPNYLVDICCKHGFVLIQRETSCIKHSIDYPKLDVTSQFTFSMTSSGQIDVSRLYSSQLYTWSINMHVAIMGDSFSGNEGSTDKRTCKSCLVMNWLMSTIQKLQMLYARLIEVLLKIWRYWAVLSIARPYRQILLLLTHHQAACKFTYRPRWLTGVRHLSFEWSSKVWRHWVGYWVVCYQCRVCCLCLEIWCL